MPTRRKVLRLIGGGTVVAAVSGGAACSNKTSFSDSAREPWRQAGQYDDYRKRALSYALLAPNPHNRQPWLVRLDGSDALTLFVDLDRRLPATDPFDRQITIGCGAFLEILSIAAAEEGYRVDLVLFPEGEDLRTLDQRAIARIEFIAGEGVRDPLFRQILARRSNKEIYEPRDIPDSALAALAEASRSHSMTANTVGNTSLTATLRDLTWRAHVKEVTTPAANQESVDLMRIGAKEVAANPDGIELEGGMIEIASRLGIVTREALADPTSTAFKQGLELYEKMAKSARAFGWISNSNATRADQINAGRAYVRMNLKATELGLGVHPWSQCLQEYPEMEALYREVHELIGDGQTVQMLYRIGYAEKIEPTPRRGLKAHLVKK
jgi:nitroreductase